MTTACGICGKLNRKNARFCVGCAARLGVEPVVTSIPGPTFADSRRDVGLDSTRIATDHSRPTPLRAAAPAREPAMFWLRAGLAGLVLLIGFVGWCMYVLTSHKAVVPLQASTNASVPSSESRPQAEPAPTVASPVAPVATPTLAESPAPGASSRVATLPPLAPAARPPPATGTEADASIAATSPSTAGRGADAARRRPTTAPRSYARERSRRQESPDTDTSGLAPNFGWVAPLREPANTLNPGYADPGPPVVPGPGPRYASSIPSPVEAPPAYEGVAPSRGPDAGPPIVPGPGPRYDYSSPGAIPR
ncbi:hypothetical protein [Variovorax sp. dw_308]|uniref:hypothetical protein n=1 Tax=Variovorax sp. dw_308 TaxID=2721546 RepID=UPI001C459A1A|nr:hypothetical protein [Variovorax sp. dw_308]